MKSPWLKTEVMKGKKTEKYFPFATRLIYTPFLLRFSCRASIHPAGDDDDKDNSRSLCCRSRRPAPSDSEDSGPVRRGQDLQLEVRQRSGRPPAAALGHVGHDF